MPYSSLSAEDQQSVDNLLAAMRPAFGAYHRLLDELRAIDNLYIGETDPILLTLADGDLIPNKTGLPDAEEVTKAQVVSMISNLRVILDGDATITGGGQSMVTDGWDQAVYRQLLIKFSGITTALGT